MISVFKRINKTEKEPVISLWTFLFCRPMEKLNWSKMLETWEELRY
jgi:hypothetical protein